MDGGEERRSGKPILVSIHLRPGLVTHASTWGQGSNAVFETDYVTTTKKSPIIS